MSERIDAITERLLNARARQNTVEPSDLELEQFNPVAVEMIGEFVTSQLDAGAPHASLIKIAETRSPLALRADRIMRPVLIATPFVRKKPTSQRPEIFNYHEIPGWRFAHRGNRHYAIVAAEDPSDYLIRESWVTDKEPTQTINPANYAITLYNCGIKTPDALEQRLDTFR